MNNFKRIKIRTKPHRAPLSQKTKQNLVTALTIVLIFLGVYYVGAKIVENVRGSQIFGFFSGIIGKDLETDAQNHTNILIMGVGGEGHEGRDLTDTIIVASLDHTNNRVSLLSLPRDIYVESTLGGGRVNRLYADGKKKWGAEQGLDFTRETLNKMLNVPIPYVIKVDFKAFEEIVDSMGGVDIYVNEAINDPFYPNEETYEYMTFTLPAGQQHLDGDTALKYARSRKTTSDFDRSKRQQQLLIALKNQASKQSLFGKQQFLKETYYSLRENVETNLSMREMLSLAAFASNWDSSNLASATLNDNPYAKGGFFYTPLRELYGGAYVLLPASDTLKHVQKFVQFIFYGPANFSKVKIAILNGTKQGGIAGRASTILSRFGMLVSKTANAAEQNKEKTVWYIRSPNEKSVALLGSTLIPGEIVEVLPDVYLQNPDFAEAGIILELGPDSTSYLAANEIFRNIVSVVPTEAQTAQPAAVK